MPPSGFNYMEQGMMFNPFQGYPPQMFRMPFPNQYNIWQPGNFPNRGYNSGYKPKYSKRGGYRGGYNKNNHQRKNNNVNKQNQNNNENQNNYQKENKEVVEENKQKFDYETFNKLTDEEKRDFLGERLFNAIQESPAGKNIDIDTIGKITGMIIAIPKEEEIIEILENPSVLDSRILEVLSLLQKNK